MTQIIKSTSGEIAPQLLSRETIQGLKEYAVEFFARIQTLNSNEFQKAIFVLDKIGEDLNSSLFRMRHNPVNSNVDGFKSFEELNELNKIINQYTRTNKRKTFRWVKRRKQRQVAKKYVKFETTYNQAYKTIVESKDTLKRESILRTLLKDDKVQLFDKLNEYIFFIEILKETFTQTKAQFTEKQQEEILFALNSKHQDLLTKSLIVAQSYQASVITLHNNNLLLKNVEDALSVTLVALRTAQQLKENIDNSATVYVENILDYVDVDNLAQQVAEEKEIRTKAEARQVAHQKETVNRGMRLKAGSSFSNELEHFSDFIHSQKIYNESKRKPSELDMVKQERDHLTAALNFHQQERYMLEEKLKRMEEDVFKFKQAHYNEEHNKEKGQ